MLITPLLRYFPLLYIRYSLSVSPSPLSLNRLYDYYAGERDFAKQNGIELLDSFVDPFVIHHSEGHVIPKLGNTVGKSVFLGY